MERGRFTLVTGCSPRHPVGDSRAVKGVWLATKSAFDTYEEGHEEIVPRDTKRAKIAPPRGGSGRAADRSACKIEHRPSETGR